MFPLLKYLWDEVDFCGAFNIIHFKIIYTSYCLKYKRNSIRKIELRDFKLL